MIGCPVFTPYKQNGEINYDCIPSYALLIAKLKFDCVLVGGTTGDWALLTLEERKCLLSAWVNQCKQHNIKIAFNISDSCIDNVHVLLNEAKKLEVWCVLIVGSPIVRTNNIVEYLSKATKNYNFIYYHYPELYGYNNVKLDNILQIANCIGIKIVDNSISIPKTHKLLFISDENYKKGYSTFTSELNIFYLTTETLQDINNFVNENCGVSEVIFVFLKMFLETVILLY